MNRKHGQFIVLDGADGVGKTTQVNLLVSALRASGHDVLEFDFPCYEGSEAGRLLKRALRGEFGDFLGLSPYLSSWLFTLDRATSADKILEALWAGSVVISNRYTPSNIAYQAAKLPIEEQDEFIQILEEMEYGELKLPRPSLVIYLSVPERLARLLIEKRGGEKDQHEKDLAYQAKVNAMYRKLASLRSDWHIVECSSSSGKMFTRGTIHRRVLQIARDAISNDVRVLIHR